MSGYMPTRGNLITATHRQMIFLTLALFCFFSSPLCRADSYYTPEEKTRIDAAENYIRKQSLRGVSLLPSDMRTAMGWLSGGWHAMPSLSGDDGAETPVQPQNMVQSDTPEQQSGVTPVGLASNFHHKGFLPTHDAMVMGIGFGHSLFDHKLQFTTRPFYGQSWGALQGYWGAEMALDIVQRPDGMPFGKITLGYIGGNEALTDRGRGMDLHGDVDLTNGWKFTSGLRQNSADGNSNYVMLRWKLNFN
jgi:hypothetical protein